MKQIISLLAFIAFTTPALATSNYLNFEGIKEISISNSVESSEIHYDYRDKDIIEKEWDTEDGYRVRISAAAVYRKVGHAPGKGQLINPKGEWVSFGFDPNNPLHQACLVALVNAKNASFHDTGAGIGCSKLND